MTVLKAIAIDCDGTIFNSTPSISPRNNIAFKTLVDKNFIPFFATSRSLDAVIPVVSEKVLQEMNYQGCAPGVFMNGSYVLGRGGKVLCKKSMSQEEYQTCIDISKRLDIFDKCFVAGYNHISSLMDFSNWSSTSEEDISTDDSINSTEETQEANTNEDISNTINGVTHQEESTHIHSDSNQEFPRFDSAMLEKQTVDINKTKLLIKPGVPPPILIQPKSQSETLDCVTIFISNLFTDTQMIVNEINKDLPPTLICHQSSPNYIEICLANLNKKTGIELILKDEGLDFDSLVAIGDNDNDLPMLQVAALPIAMGNANQACKDIAKIVVNTNDNDGFSDAVDFIINH